MRRMANPARPVAPLHLTQDVRQEVKRIQDSGDIASACLIRRDLLGAAYTSGHRAG